MQAVTAVLSGLSIHQWSASLQFYLHAVLQHCAAAMQVLASFGHVRDLPAKAESVQPDKDFDMLWERLRAARPRLQEIAQATKQAQTLILATDPDREGEAISWHLQEELAVCLPLCRFSPHAAICPSIDIWAGLELV